MNLKLCVWKLEAKEMKRENLNNQYKECLEKCNGKNCQCPLYNPLRNYS